MLRSKDRIFLLVLFAIAIFGFLLLNDYGESWDEHLQYKQYASHALDSYGTWFREGRSEGQWEGGDESTGIVKDFHGPSFVMVSELFARFAQRLHPNWPLTDLHHFMHFLAFQIGVFSLYFLCCRWLGEWASFGATLLFVAQPVFWGHGFINPKDMPFAAMFLLSMLLGLRMYDYLYESSGGRWGQIAADWKTLSIRTKRTLTLATVIWAVSVLMLFAGVDLIHTLLANLIQDAYAHPASAMAAFLSRFAEDLGNVPANVYIQKFFVLFLRLRGTYTLLSTLGLLVWIRIRFRPGLRLLGWPVLLAGFAVGFATSMRIAGPLAGLLVAVYLFGRVGKKAILPMILYGGVGVTVMYLTWPYLWSGPIERLLEGLQVMSAFPWRGQTLFNGVYYSANAIPRTYLPTLLGLQLTEPVWFLCAAGLAAAGWGLWKMRKYGGLLFLVIGWFLLPLLGFIFSGTSLYDNFRQVLFILPPVFLAIGVFLDWLFERLQPALWRSLLLVLLIFPGVYAGVQLHPYEYAYYNSFIGGVGGAFRRFETEYWVTSFRQAADFLNENAKPNASVLAIGPSQTLSPFLRPDLKMADAEPNYVVIMTRYNADLENYTDLPDWYRVERDGAVFAVIRVVSEPEK